MIAETRIGFIGIGAMGSRMAANLARAGHPLTVHDTDPDKVKAFTQSRQARAATSLAEAVLLALNAGGGQRSKVVLSAAVHPRYRAVVRTYLRGTPAAVLVGDEDSAADLERLRLKLDQLTAALVILLTGWARVDALVGIGIAGLILHGAWGLVGEAVDVLMEAVPAHVDVEALQRALEAVDGVEEVHDLHVWTLTTGRYALSAHAVLDPSRRHDAVLDALTAVCRTGFRVDHVTIQLEGENRRPMEPPH